MPGSFGHEEQDAQTFASWVIAVKRFSPFLDRFLLNHAFIAILKTGWLFCG